MNRLRRWYAEGKLDYVLLFVSVALLGAILFSQAGCFGLSPRVEPPPVPFTGPPAPEASANATVDYLRLLVRWVCGACVLVGFVSAGAAIWCRSAMLGGLSATCFGLLCLGLFTDWLLAHWLVAVVLVGIAVVGTVGVLLWYVWQNQRAAIGAIRVAEYLKPKVETEEARKHRRGIQAVLCGPAAKTINKIRMRIMPQAKPTTKPPA